MEKKIIVLILLLLSQVLSAQKSYEDIALPSFAGLEPDELNVFLNDWNEKMDGIKIHQTSKKHDHFDWHLAVEFSPTWNDKQGCWNIQKLWFRLPAGKYKGLIPLGRNADQPPSRLKMLYFGKQSEGVQISDEITSEDYYLIVNALKMEESIELRSGKTAGTHLAEMISLIDRTERKEFWVEFRQPFNRDTLICNISQDGLTYRAEQSAIE